MTVRKETRRVRRARRSAAFHAARSSAAATPVEAYEAAEYALRAAAAHTRHRSKVRDLRHSIVEHVHDVLVRGDASDRQRELYEQKLAATGSEATRLSTALMCLRGALKQLDDAQRDQAIGHYTNHFQQQANHISGGVR